MHLTRIRWFDPVILQKFNTAGGVRRVGSWEQLIRDRKSEVGGSTEKLSQRHSEKLKTSDARELFATACPPWWGESVLWRIG